MEEKLNADFFSRLFNDTLKPWIKRQRWFLEKSYEISSVRIVDFFEIKTESAAAIFGIICDVVTSNGNSTYYVPLIFRESPHLSVTPDQPDHQDLKDPPDRILEIDIGGNVYSVYPAEYDIVYQDALRRSFLENKRLETGSGNLIVFTAKTEKARRIFQGEISGSKNLLEGTGTSSNILTDVKYKSCNMVIKTIKKAATDIEMEMYDALSGEGFKNMPGYHASFHLEYGNSGKIPLCLGIEKIKGPEELAGESWRLKAGFIISDFFLKTVQEYAGEKECRYQDFMENRLSRNIKKSLDETDKFGLKVDLSYDDLINKLGEIIAEFNISLANSDLENFGKAVCDKDLMNEKFIIEFIISIEKKIQSLKTGNLTFQKYFKDCQHSIIMKTDLIINSLPEIYISRIHGDMQLDQILFDADFNPVIIDFGGAPVMDINEKRAKAPAFYDLAGLIRAFGYIKFYCLKKHFGSGNDFIFNSIINHHEGVSPNPVIEFAGFVEETLKNSLVKSYLDHLEKNDETDIISDTWNRNAVIHLVEFCTISRALYEINYELSARPDEENALIPLESIIKTLI
jgi:hypothetical protein